MRDSIPICLVSKAHDFILSWKIKYRRQVIVNSIFPFPSPGRRGFDGSLHSARLEFP